MDNIKIIAVREHPEYLERAVDYFSSKWGIAKEIYRDCISNSLTTESPLPRWYLMIKNNEIIGSYGLIVNDFISRQDLWPWLCAVYIEESERGKALGSRLLEHGRKEAAKLGFSMVYLCTDHIGFYERYGWRYIGGAYGVSGSETRVYEVESIPQETDEERRARIYPIILSEYNPAWSEWYAEEKANLERLIGTENIARISHFGSTSVPGLTAKPTVDILLEIAETVTIEDLIALLPNEYICLRREGNSLSEHDLVMIIKGYTDTGSADKVFHIHVSIPGDNPHGGDWDELYFRDYLIAHPEAAAEYAALKRKLFKDYEHDRDGYTAAKGEFIKEITKKAREEVAI